MWTIDEPRGTPPAGGRARQRAMSLALGDRMGAAALLAFATGGCASMASLPAPDAGMVQPEVRVRTVGMDRLTEYRARPGRAEGVPARVVEIAPGDGPPSQLIDDDGDGRIDRHLGQVPARYAPALHHRMPFEDYGLVGAPLPPRRDCDQPRQPVPSVICQAAPPR